MKTFWLYVSTADCACPLHALRVQVSRYSISQGTDFQSSLRGVQRRGEGEESGEGESVLKWNTTVSNWKKSKVNPLPRLRVYFWVRVLIWVKNRCVCSLVCVFAHLCTYLQGSIFTERGHTLHETTHFVCYRFDDLRQHARDKVLRNREDLKGNKNQQVNVGLAIKKKKKAKRCKTSVILPLHELWWWLPALPLGSFLHLMQKKRCNVNDFIEIIHLGSFLTHTYSSLLFYSINKLNYG